MTHKIIVYTLKGCDVCNNLKILLNESNISYLEKQCEKFNDDCDYIERLTGCEYYPMVYIKTKNNSNSILCLANKHEEIEKTIRLNPMDILIYKQSIHTLYEYIKIYNKN